MNIHKIPEHTLEILSCAAKLVVEDGLEYGAAKRQARKQLGLPSHTHLPDNDRLEDAVKEHISIFCADTQPVELKKLRQIALSWMRVMKDFSPHISGAVWNGTATRHSDIYIQLFCDDPKSPEIHLLNQNIRYTPTEIMGFNQESIYTLCASTPVPEWQQTALALLAIYDSGDIRGALKTDKKKRPKRGNTNALEKLLSATDI